jgi:hypothetical protein
MTLTVVLTDGSLAKFTRVTKIMEYDTNIYIRSREIMLDTNKIHKDKIVSMACSDIKVGPV